MRSVTSLLLICFITSGAYAQQPDKGDIIKQLGALLQKTEGKSFTSENLTTTILKHRIIGETIYLDTRHTGSINDETVNYIKSKTYNVKWDSLSKFSATPPDPKNPFTLSGCLTTSNLCTRTIELRNIKIFVLEDEKLSSLNSFKVYTLKEDEQKWYSLLKQLYDYFNPPK